MCFQFIYIELDSKFLQDYPKRRNSTKMSLAIVSPKSHKLPGYGYSHYIELP